MFISNNLALFHLWSKENLVKDQKVSKYFENDWKYQISVQTDNFNFVDQVFPNKGIFGRKWKK